MRSTILLLLLLCSGICSYAQSGEGLFYVFKRDWSPAKSFDLCEYFMNQTKISDTEYVCRYYRKTGPMVRWETYKDSALEIPNGRFAWYDEHGDVDTIGSVKNGKKDGDWQCGFDEKGKAKLVAHYANGKLDKTIDNVARLITFADKHTEPLDKPKDTSTHNSTAITIVQRPAEFPGGVNGWLNYLTKNLKTPARFLNNNYIDRKAPVILSFLIDREGKTEDVFVYHSSEWSVDTEAMRIIKQSPKWTPAVQNGQTVIYRHKQSITFRID